MTTQMKILPPDRADVTAFMRMLFLRTEREIINAINRKRGAGHVDYAEVAALERVQRILQNMVDESWAYVPTMIEKIFYHSDKDASGYANARRMTETFSAPQIAIIQQLTDNLLGEIAEVSETVYKSVQTVYTIARLEADPFRETALKQGFTPGGSRRPHGLTAVRLWYRRCKTRELPLLWTRQGANGPCRVMGIWLSAQLPIRQRWQPSSQRMTMTCGRSQKLAVPVRYAQRLRDGCTVKSGTNPDYPPLSLAFGKVDPDGSDDLTNTYLNIHPNCLHSFIKYTTIGKTERQIQKDKDFSDPEKNPINRDPRTKKQIKAYREKERNRQRHPAG